MVPGDGIASSDAVLAAAEIAARRVIAADFEALALRAGSVISASLFGALAAAEVLPFPRAAFEAAIAGKGAEASLRAFAAGYEAALGATVEALPAQAALGPKGPARLMGQWDRLAGRAQAMPCAEMAMAGLRKVVEFQDLAYGAEYLARLDRLIAQDKSSYEFSRQAAKYVANAMAYDDVIRVADLKTRAGRSERIATEMGAKPDNLVQVLSLIHIS